MAKMQVFTYDNLELYDELLKGHISAEDAKSLKTVAIDGNTLKFYKVSEPVGDTAPAYSINLPETDLSGLIPKITGATDGNVAQTKADGTIKDSGVKVADLATKSEVEAVQDAVDAINDAESGILKTAKDYADTKDTEIKNTIGTVTEGKTVVEMIQDNADAIEAHKTAVDAKVTTLVGEDADKSVRTIANEELAAQLLSGKADADFKTLQELAAWLEDHPEEVTAINLDITNIKKLVGTIPEGATATDIVNYIKELVDAEKTRATGIESGLDTRLSAVETLVGEGGSVDDKIATAKTEAIASAKDYSDNLNTAMDTRVTSLEALVGEGYEAIPSESIRALFATSTETAE